MLLGEYAVLHGKHALVCAVDKRITVSLAPRTDTQIEIISPTLGHLLTEIKHFRVDPPFQFVLTVLKKYQKKLKQGFTLTIESEFSHQVGLGSSAAVTVATLAVLTAWLSIPLNPLQLIREARAVIQAVQGRGSGADVAASVLGGIVSYQMQPLMAEKQENYFPLTVIYSGYKTPTAEAIQQVKQVFTNYPSIFKQLMQSIDACALQGVQAIRDQDWQMFGNIMNIQQGLMESLGVSTPLLSGIVNVLRKKNNIFGAKISGSGLGDCIIGLGTAEMVEFTDQQIQQIPVSISEHGVICEKV
jgi:mevalonate kinase